MSSSMTSRVVTAYYRAIRAAGHTEADVKSYVLYMNPADVMDYAGDAQKTIHVLMEDFRGAGCELVEDDSVPIGKAAWDFSLKEKKS